MHYYISTHITQAVFWYIQGRIYNCFQHNSDFLQLKYNQQKVETTSELSSVPVRMIKIPRKIYTTWFRFQSWHSTCL